MIVGLNGCLSPGSQSVERTRGRQRNGWLVESPPTSDIGDLSQSEGFPMRKSLKLIVEQHSDGFVAYPLGMKGVVVGEGDTYEEAVTDVTSAIAFHLETFGPDVFDDDERVLEAFITETGVTI